MIKTLLLILIIFAQSAYSWESIWIDASSVHSTGYDAINAFDGDLTTRWAGRPGKEKGYLQIDFGEIISLGDIAIYWENAFAAHYDILVSNDGENWLTMVKIRDGKGGTETHKFLNSEGRYFRMDFKKFGPHGLYSIWNIDFFSDEIDAMLREFYQNIDVEFIRYYEARSVLKDEYGTDAVIFAIRKIGDDGHWYANFGYFAHDPERALSFPGGQLCVLNLQTGDLEVLIYDKEGSVRDPVLHYDAEKILFSYRLGDSRFFHLYEINIDGSGLRQLTDGPYDDIEPIYLPDGGIMFVSSRSNRWVQCWLTPVATIYRCDADGGNIQQLSANIEHDNTPWVMPDGRILYTRWEYVDRSQVDYHHLWTMNPDGTSQMVYYGNMHPGGLYISAKPIPDSMDVLMIHSPGHGLEEHAGWVSRVNNLKGPDERSSLRPVSPTSNRSFRDPYPLSVDHYIVARDNMIELMHSDGRTVPLYELGPELTAAGFAVHEPRPVRQRQREPIIAARNNPELTEGKLLLANAHIGRNMEGVEPGTITSLLIVETLPKPINFTGGMDPISYSGTFTLQRILGRIPVEPDGSAFMKLPANRAVFFVALDKDDNAVKRMQSFTSVVPGEVTSCIGCHEQRREPPYILGQMMPIAASKPPNRPQPIYGVPAIFDYPRDIQPILDRHCIDCHNPRRPEGGVMLTGDHGPMFSHSYFELTIKKQIADGRNLPRGNYPPYSLGASASPLMNKVLNGHYGVELSENEIKKLRFWIESAAAYPGTYAALGTGMIGGYQVNEQVINNDRNWPESIRAVEAIQRNCIECHAGTARLPSHLSDEIGISFWRPNFDDPRLRFSRHRVFNLSQPEKSLMLLATLGKTPLKVANDMDQAVANGGERHPVVFENENHADYQAILAMIQAGKRRLSEVKRFDMEGFRPRQEYIREMIKYGVLPQDFDLEKSDIDVYELDEQYWQSLWYRP